MQNRSTHSDAYFAAALTFDPQEHTTLALITGLQKHEISNICVRLRHSQDYTALPMLLPALLLEGRVDSTTRRVVESHQEIYDVEQVTGLLTTWDLPSGSGRESSSPKLWGTQDFQDFNRVTWQLTSVSAKLAYCTYNCQVHLPMLDELDQIDQELVNGSPPGRQPDLQRVNACLQANNAFLRARLQATSVRATYLSQRAQAQVQTVSRTQLHRTDPILTSSRG